ncbi:ParB N-terminal domain-containing protein [Acetobacterium wieringae]|uniref:ParB/RepB/Spo0J family partition protein n=1 Tax=Acetobacterium wieringae TaxID=52694 RepID=UPI0026EE4221|nr:ParB N-terminal domain-containing protein [Acetobacterium wieringae]
MADYSESSIYARIEVNRLIDFKNHIFTKYNESEMKSMMESIEDMGVTDPILVRPHNEYEGMFEIISGHNRVEACKRLGKRDIHAVIYEGLKDDSAAELMLIETNIKKRSLNDYVISEKAKILTRRHQLMKILNKRKAQLSEIERSQYDQLEKDNPFNIGKRQIISYVQIHNNLTQGLKDLCDSGKLSIKSAVELSYLSDAEQDVVRSFMLDGNKISFHKANIMRKKMESVEITMDVLNEIFKDKALKKKPEKTYKISPEIIEKYFQDLEDEGDIQMTIELALDQYFSQSS